MKENAVQKCRTCLKKSTKTCPVTKQVRKGSGPKKTYRQLLKEYAKLECPSDYEHLMPQYLCLPCCRELRQLYDFLEKAHNCNMKLLDVIMKNFDCLQEKCIDLPQNEKDLDASSCNIKMEDGDNNKDINTELLQQRDTNDELNTIMPLKDEVSCKEPPFNGALFQNDNPDGIEGVDNEQIEPASSSLKHSRNTNITTTTTDEKLSKSFHRNTTCPVCNKAMNRHDNLLKHMRSLHNIKDPNNFFQKPTDSKKEFSCQRCPDKYTNKHIFLLHLKDKHGLQEEFVKVEKERKAKKIIKCRSCDYIAKSYAALNYHTRSKHGTEEDKFKCKFCSYMSYKRFDLLTHVKNSHKDLIKTLKAESTETLHDHPTNICLKTEMKQDLEFKHSLDENDASPSFGDDIPENIKSPASSNTPKDFEEEQFSDEEFIRNILNIKKRQTKSISSLAQRCDECGNIYKNYKALYVHQKHVHISEDKYSLCPHCGKKYKRKADLCIHIKKAHIPTTAAELAKQPVKAREKRFMCPHCSYVCTTITILNIHINRHHTGVKPYKCDICFKSFIVPYDLKIHRYLHTGERPYKCPICSKGFRDNSHMIKHKRIHSAERPYKCKECGKSFTQSYNLSVHRRTHLKEKQLNCGVCGRVFENGSLLNLHRINENHQDEVV